MRHPIDYFEITSLTCTICLVTKLVSEFGKFKDATAPLTGWRYYSRCRECNREQCAAYGRNNRQKRNQRLREWRRSNPEAAKRGDRRDRLRRKYGLTEVGLSEIIKAQNGKCALCFRSVELVVDHCHKSGKVRSLLCHRCNISLGWIESHPGIIERIQQYVDQPCHADILLEVANA